MTTSNFPDPVRAAQSAFRAIMDAAARPGTVRALAGCVSAPAPLSPGAAAIAMTLFDHDTLVWLDHRLAAEPEVAAWLRIHTGAAVVAESRRAAFAVISDPGQTPPFDAFQLGTPDYPDQSTTLVLQVDDFDAGPVLVLRGPGIKDRQAFRAAPVPPDIAARIATNRAWFPRGVDLLFVASDAVAALPRSVQIEGT